MPLDLVGNRARRTPKRSSYRTDAPAITKSQLNRCSVNYRQLAPGICHPTTLNHPLAGGCSLRNLNPPFFLKKEAKNYIEPGGAEEAE
jgi:hypothetical protein